MCTQRKIEKKKKDVKESWERLALYEIMYMELTSSNIDIRIIKSEPVNM